MNRGAEAAELRVTLLTAKATYLASTRRTLSVENASAENIICTFAFISAPAALVSSPGAQSRWPALCTVLTNPASQNSRLQHHQGQKAKACATHRRKLICPLGPVRMETPAVPVEPAVLGVGLGLEADGSMNFSPAVLIVGGYPFRGARQERRRSRWFSREMVGIRVEMVVGNECFVIGGSE